MEAIVANAWKQLCARYTADQATIQQLWSEIEKAYTAKDRHYHNLDHIVYMLELANRYKMIGSDFDMLLFAIYYHDIVYKATRSDNEAQSAAIAKARLRWLGIPDASLELVKEMINATKAHQHQVNDHINLLIDLDLAILGADDAHYDWYRKGVRKEYSIYPDLIYKPGRRKVLQHFLSQEHIYKTPTFQAEFENKARANLRRELEFYS